MPIAPDATHFGWQGQQVVSNGACTGTVSLAVGGTAVCFGRSDGKMVCAGKIGPRTFGTSFVDVGAGEVDQIFLSRNVSFGNGPAQGACIRSVASGQAMCLGNYNAQGQFGNGSTSVQTIFQTWGMQPVKHFATGTWDQFCGLDFLGSVRCAGFNFGMVPVMQPMHSARERMWVTGFGTVSIDDVTTFRVSNGRSSCRVTAAGLECEMSMVPAGTGGQVVDGFRFGPPSPGGDERCWLDTRARVFCSTGPHFERLPVLTIAADFDTTSLCAVYADRSVWCFGSNEEGKLGTGSLNPVPVETQVAPPGSVEIVGCP